MLIPLTLMTSAKFLCHATKHSLRLQRSGQRHLEGIFGRRLSWVQFSDLESSCQAEFRMNTSLFHALSSSKTLEAGTAQMNSSSICHSLAPTASLAENLSELQLGISYSLLPPRQRTGFRINNNVICTITS